MHFTWVSQPCNAKNIVNTTVFDSVDGGGVEPTTSGLQATGEGVNSDSIRKSAGPAPGIFLVKQKELIIFIRWGSQIPLFNAILSSFVRKCGSIGNGGARSLWLESDGDLNVLHAAGSLWFR